MHSAENMYRGNAALTTLTAYYPVVSTLHAYLGDVLDTQGLDVQLLRDADDPRYRSLLETTYVAVSQTHADLRHFVPMPAMSHMQDVSVNALVIQPSRMTLTMSYV